jgi:hypothetical protein
MTVSASDSDIATGKGVTRRIGGPGVPPHRRRNARRRQVHRAPARAAQAKTSRKGTLRRAARERARRRARAGPRPTDLVASVRGHEWRDAMPLTSEARLRGRSRGDASPCYDSPPDPGKRVPLSLAP